MMGIDEAGRGPVLGPLVYASVVVPVADAGRLHDLGCDDSKALTEAQRDALLARMAAAPFLQIQTVTLSAATLSAAMTRRPPVSLNTLSFDAAFALVRDALRRGIHLTALYVDTVGDPDRYATRLRSTFPSIATVVVAKKADATYRVVGAASIAAKCKRDRDLRAWVFEEEGSGVLPLGVVGEKMAAAEGEGAAAEGGPPTPVGSAAAAVVTARLADGPLPPVEAVPNGDSVVWDEGGSDEEGEADGEEQGDSEWRPSGAGCPTADDQRGGSPSAGAVISGTATAAAAAPPLALTFGRTFGSGYPGDGVTKAWLVAHVDPVFGFPSLVRFSWSTVRVLLANTPAVVRIRWEGDDNDERDAATRATPAITSFFGASLVGRTGAGLPSPPHRVVAPFFRSRYIAPATSFFA
ncbi:hypothetical protein MMPV_006189 [Pyropia vietnamensis]